MAHDQSGQYAQKHLKEDQADGGCWFKRILHQYLADVWVLVSSRTHPFWIQAPHTSSTMYELCLHPVGFEAEIL